MTKRINISSDVPWEDLVGYSRAVRIGNLIEVTGTVAAEGGKVVAPNDPYGQTVFILKKIEKALKEAGGCRQDVIRTRMFVTDISQWEKIGKAHGEFFQGIKPATSMIEVKGLISQDYLIEIEATAVVGDPA
ncbi:MAG: RidA family protein [Saprospiraceae bacterium]|nr:RidA family protein [Saprospiraceae bacterium]